MKAGIAPNTAGLLRILDVANMLGVTPTQVEARAERTAEFPQPIRQRPKVWKAADVIAWRNARRRGNSGALA